MKKTTEYRIKYITTIDGEELNEYASTETEVREKTDRLIAKGYYIKDLAEWNEYQYRYTRKASKDYLKMYDVKQNTKNCVTMMKNE